MRTAFFTLLLALGGLGFAPVASAADCQCGQPKCQCTDCNPKCRCCGPKATEGAEQGCPIKPHTPKAEQSSGSRFSPSKSPVTEEGVRVTADLPTSQHHRNTGGMGRRGPGSGAGLCVYTSAWHAAIWQNIPEIYGFRDWMQNKPGGSWPEKFDSTLAQYCREKGIEVPGYVQHTGGDMDFLRQALKTGRMVCVTYAGRDDFYKDRWGRPAPISHMVNLVYLDDKWAVIVDNNRPGVFLRMSVADFTERWLAMSGGWAFVFTAPAPPPYATKPAQEFLAGPRETFLVDEEGQEAGVVQAVLDEMPANEVVTYAEGVKEAKEKGVPLVTFVGDFTTPLRVHGCVVAKAPALAGFNPGDVVVSKWIAGKHVGIKTTVGRGNDVANWVAEVDRAVAQLDPKNQETIRNFGVDFTKISREKRYSVNGREASKKDAFEQLSRGASLADDSGRANVAFVDAPRAKVPADLRAMFNVQSYQSGRDDWAIEQFKLKPGMTLREADAPTIDRVGKEVRVVVIGDLTDELILAILNEFLNPKPPVPQPQPVPVPQPDPAPDQPSPVPAPGPSPSPQPPPAPVVSDRSLLVALAVAVALYLFRKYL